MEGGRILSALKCEILIPEYSQYKYLNLYDISYVWSLKINFDKQ